MAFVAKDMNGEEWIYETKPQRLREYFKCKDELDSMVELPKGSIRKLIGRELTWEDEPVELKEND